MGDDLCLAFRSFQRHLSMNVFRKQSFLSLCQGENIIVFSLSFTHSFCYTV